MDSTSIMREQKVPRLLVTYSAPVFLSYLCNQAEIPCYPVEGLKDGEPWYWNVIEFEDGFRHVDFQTQALSEGSVRFLTDDEMEGYEWDRDSVPACTLAAEDETEG